MIVSATGYACDVPYLPELDEELFRRTFDPDLPGLLGVMGQFLAQGRTSRCWSCRPLDHGRLERRGGALPPDDEMRRVVALAPRPPLGAYNALARHARRAARR